MSQEDLDNHRKILEVMRAMLRRNRCANECMAIGVFIHSINIFIGDLRKLLKLLFLMLYQMLILIHMHLQQGAPQS